VHVTFINTLITLTTCSNRFKGARSTTINVHGDRRSQQPAFPATSVHSNHRPPTNVQLRLATTFTSTSTIASSQRLLRLFHHRHRLHTSRGGADHEIHFVLENSTSHVKGGGQPTISDSCLRHRLNMLRVSIAQHASSSIQLASTSTTPPSFLPPTSTSQ